MSHRPEHGDPHYPPPSVPHATAWAHLVAAFVVLLQLWAAGRYGIFRDELYYLACARHMAWGYVDQPPFSIFALKVWRHFFGQDLVSLRFLPALLDGASAIAAALLAREMGGRRLSQILSAVAVGLMPGVLAVGGFFSMNAFDVFFWLVIVLIAARLLRGGGGPGTWLLLGFVSGCALLNKYDVVLLLAGLGLGFLLSPQRDRLFERGRWLGMGLAVLMFLPHLIWQASHGWPTLEFMHNARTYKIAHLSPLAYAKDALLLMQPLAAPLVLLGIAALFGSRRLRTFRPLGWAIAVPVVVLALSGGKPYYSIPAWTLAAVAGAAYLGTAQRLARRVRRMVSGAYAAVLLVASLAIAPLAIPLLPVDSFLAYQKALGIAPTNAENNTLGSLPQHFADRFGWEELVRDVGEVIDSLPTADRESCLILAGNYGEAGALDYFGPERKLPRVVCGQNSYWLWGVPRRDWRVVVAVGIGESDLKQYFDDVELAGFHTSEYAMPYETNLPIFVCRGPKLGLDELWPRLKNFI